LARAAVTLETERIKGPNLDVYDDDKFLTALFAFLGRYKVLMIAELQTGYVTTL
jgi:hypothetical protein